MHDHDIYVKTDAGRDEIRSRAHGLSMSVRAILLMIDGQRNIASVRQVIAGSKAPADVLDQLVAQGLIVPANGAVAAPAADFVTTAILEPPPPEPAPPSVPPAPPPPVPPPEPAAPVDVAPPASLHTPNRNAATGSPSVQELLRDVPLDFVLPTIIVTDPPSVVGASTNPPTAGPSIVTPLARAMPFAAARAPAASTPPTPAAEPAAPPAPLNRYEHLYQMMNEIVRDFLSPTRRYFFQLKIERATTAEDLLDLLGDLRAALAKAKGDAFAGEVIARVRNAAN